MKSLKRIFLFATGTALVAKYVNYRQNRKEHKLILNQLRLNEDIMKVEDPGKTGIRFIKHPKSKEISAAGKISWDVRLNGAMMIQLDDNSFIIPSNPDKQFYYYFHERGHLKNKDKHFRKKNLCGYTVDDCLLEELEAEIEVIKSAKKIRKKFKESYWSKNLDFLWEQCKECLKIINQGECPNEEREKIKKCLKIITRSINK